MISNLSIIAKLADQCGFGRLLSDQNKTSRKSLGLVTGTRQDLDMFHTEM